MSWRVRAARRLFLAAPVSLALLLACAGESAPEAPVTTEPTQTATAASDTPTGEPRGATSTPAPTGTASPSGGGATARVPGEPEVERVVAHVEMLAGEIGSRPAGSEEERRAAEYIASELESYGYETTLEPFTFQARVDDSAVTLPDGVTVDSLGLGGSATGEATAPMVHAGLGSAEEIAGVDADGAVVLLDRGTLTFEQKVRNAQAAGAVAVVIVNNQAGPLLGRLEGNARVPVVGVQQSAGESLRAVAGTGAEVTVRAGVGTNEGESQNVVGRAGEQCDTYIGGHYDSVPAGPGANDNASGTAVVLELARVHMRDGLCVIAFGAEEVGLFGSQAFVEAHVDPGSGTMLNFDMAGRIDGAFIVGDDSLAQEILMLLEQAGGGFPIDAGEFPPFTASDHVSFEEAGVPAVTITSGGDPFIHTANDDLENVTAESLSVILEAGHIALTGLLEEPRR